MSVKFGRTNGQHVLHLRRKASDHAEAASVTIKSAVEWLQHPWNRTNQPKERPAT